MSANAPGSAPARAPLAQTPRRGPPWRRARGALAVGLAFAFAAGCPRAGDQPGPSADEGSSGGGGAAGSEEEAGARPGPEGRPGSVGPPGWSGVDRVIGLGLRRACVACHRFVPAEALTRGAWPRVLADMYGLAGFGEGGEAAPPRALALRWFQARAPERFVLAAGAEPDAALRRRFAIRALAPPAAPPTPAIAHVALADLVGDARLEVVACDMRHGYVLSARPYEQEQLRPLAKLRHPVHAEVVDLDGDGLRDIVVADLGAFDPGDHELGSVVWLRRAPGAARLEPIALAEGLPRPCDVRALDWDGDGDLDLAVACFGWRQKGAVALLENQGTDPAAPRFVVRVLDPRPGAVDVPVGDLLGEGRPGILAVLAQHHEEVAFRSAVALAAGGRALPLFAAPHAAWGSNGAGLVDLDGDGDLDVLTTNGDTLDDHLLKPYHGVRWLENQGRGAFRDAALAPLYGAHDAQPADLDGDGDLDVVAVAFLPQVDPAALDALALPSLVWLEQTAPRAFAARVLEARRPYHMTVAAGDYDLDGDVDLAVGNAVLEVRGRETGVRIAAWVEVWEAVGR